MSWIESHQELRDHPKKDKLAELLWSEMPIDVADYAAMGAIHCLWWWAADYAKDGDLGRYSDAQVAKGCRWHGDPKTLVDAFMSSGFVDRDRRIHGWMETTGAGIAKREADAARKRDARLAAKQEPQTRTVPGQSTDGPQPRRRTYHTTPTTQTDIPEDDGFSDFWTAYPRKVGKGEAALRWSKLTAGDRTKATAAAGHLASFVSATAPELKYVPHPATFIGPKRTFEDWAKGWPDGYGNNGRAKKARLCPCGGDLTYDEDGLHCSVCGRRIGEAAV